jgi:hypothetical protein
MLLTRASDVLAEPFRGLTTGGGLVPGLFPLGRTGVSPAPLVAAAETFLSALPSSGRAAAGLPLDSDGWRSWCNLHPFLLRHGVCLADLDAGQRAAALGLLRESLSAGGFETARGVMKLNEHLLELTGSSDEYGEWLYWISVFGTPSGEAPWGWQIDGHHLIVNCFVLGDQLVLTPMFMGSEPVHAASGAHRGTRVFAEEEAGGYALMRSLTPAQQAQATIGSELPGDVLGTAFRDNLTLGYAGVAHDELSPPQRGLLVDLVGAYVGRIPPGHAEVRLEEVRAHLDETHFAWIGRCDASSPFYYRIHSPVVLIEFDHQPGVALEGDEPSRNHIHTLVRTPNGNDYGRDLLRQHYERFDHSHPLTPHRQGRA